MARNLAANIALLDDSGQVHQFAAGTPESDLPDWVGGRIANPAVWGEDADDDESKPARGGRRAHKPADSPTE